MALSGLEIYKLLPKKNCGECGPPTCLAFALALAGGKASLDSCPYVSEEAISILDSAAQPPIATVTIGVGDRAVKLGGETELFRHDKRFYNETAVAINIDDDWDYQEVVEYASYLENMVFHRVGLEYSIQMITVINKTKDKDKYVATLKAIKEVSSLPLILVSEDRKIMEAALAEVGNSKPLLHSASEDNYEWMVELAKNHSCPLVVAAEDLNQLADLVSRITSLGHKELVLQPKSQSMSQSVANFTQIRRLALKKRFRPYGFPIFTFTNNEEPGQEALEAAVYMSKYASLVSLQNSERSTLLPLLTWRQNLYTDPQVPIRVEEKLHEVGNVTPDSPVYITTNFSLTYYSVEGEIEASKIPGYIIPIDTDGLSVLTAYADGKYEPEKITAVLERLKVAEIVNHRNLVIPGLVSVLSGKLEELSGWKVIVGPREASGIASFAKANFGQ